jgi:GxxExxY protein
MAETGTLSRQVLGYAFEVSNSLGTGFLESVYENALCIELAEREIQYQQQLPLQVCYRNQVVGNFTADILVEDKLLLELKVATEISRAHQAQLMNYLRATGISVGLLLNFGTPKLGVQRIVNQYTAYEMI